MKDIRIRLQAKSGVQEENAKRGDSVLWQNQTDDKREIKFDLWPFDGNPHVIIVGAKKRSEELKIANASVTRAYSYTIDPPLDPDGPPDEPAINVGD